MAVCSASAQDGGAVPTNEVGAFFRGPAQGGAGGAGEAVSAAWSALLTGDRRARLAARVALVEFGPGAVPTLVEALASGSDEARRQAAATLGHIADPRALAALRAAAAGPRARRDEDLLRQVAFALGAAGDRASSGLLVDHLGRVKRTSTRRAILLALGRCGDDEAAGRLTSFWDRERSQEFRGALLLALGRLGGQAARERIEDALASRKDAVRRAATLAWADLGSPLRPARLRALLGDKNPDVVKHLVLGLCLSESPEHRDLLEHPALGPAASEEIRALVAAGRGRDARGSTLPWLLERLDPRGEPELAVRRVLVFWLHAHAEEEAGEALLRFLDDADEGIARAALIGAVARDPRAIDLAGLVRERGARRGLAPLALDLLAMVDPAAADSAARAALETGGLAPAAQSACSEHLARRDRLGIDVRDLAAARIQVEVDRLGASPCWNLLRALGDEILRLEGLEGPADGRDRVRVGADGETRLLRWTKAEEDLRLWLDRHPYFDRRASREIPPPRR